MCQQEWNSAASDNYPFSIGIINEGMSEKEREIWLEQRLAEVGLTRADVFRSRIRGIDKLSFKTFTSYAEFIVTHLGDVPSSNKPVVISFESIPDIRWIQAAKTFLEAANIPFSVQVTDRQAVFHCAHFSGMACLRLAIEDEAIERLANALGRVETCSRNRMCKAARPEMLPYDPNPR